MLTTGIHSLVSESYPVSTRAGLVAFLITLFFLKTKDSLTITKQSALKLKTINSKKQTKVWKDVIKDTSIIVVSFTEAAARYVYGALEFFFIG